MGLTALLHALGTSSANPGEAHLWFSSLEETWYPRTVAVDVGKTDAMGWCIGEAAPGVLVLTHDDEDHIGGWEAFRDIGLRYLVELWVPYEWAAVVHVLANLDTREPGGPSDHNDDLKLCEFAVPADSWDSGEGDPLIEDYGIARERAQKLADSEEDSGLLEREVERELRRSEADESGGTWRGTAVEVAKRAARRAADIAGILDDATRERVRIRYFSVDHSSRSKARPWEHHKTSVHFGREWPVTIANAVEVRPARSRLEPRFLAYLLALTIQNRRALCAVLWNWRRPAALIWSDSPGTWARGYVDTHLLLRDISISTAPHHGSEKSHHDDAWRALKPFLDRPETVVVLAGGESSQGGQVHPEYLRVQRWKRACTRCRMASPAPRLSNSVLVFEGDGYPRFLMGRCICS